MAKVCFTQNLRRHIGTADGCFEGQTLREVLDALFTERPEIRSYVLDDQGQVRQHVVIFIDGRQSRDREGLSDEVNTDSEIYVMQALSGGL